MPITFVECGEARGKTELTRRACQTTRNFSIPSVLNVVFLGAAQWALREFDSHVPTKECT